MALITCPECNHEISDTASVCPNCGYSLKVSKTEEIKNRMKGNSKKIIIGVCILICAIVAIMIYTSTPHGEDEKLVKMVVEDIQDELLEPDSMEVLECYTYCLDSSMEDGTDYSHLEKYDNRIYCSIYYKATNKSGGITDEKTLAYINEDGELDYYIEIDIESFKEPEFEYALALANASSSAKQTFNLTDHTAKANKWVK